MKYEEVLRTLKKGDYAPVYVLFGDEAYYIDIVSDWIENNVLDEVARSFDQTIVYGKDLPDSDVASVISAARGFPMMGAKQVIIVKEAQNIKKWEALGMYMDNPQPTTVLVFCFKYGSPDRRQSVFKNMEANGGVMMPSERLRDYQVEKWVRTYLAERLAADCRGVSFDPKVPQLLAEYIGSDLSAIVGSVDKLIAGLPPDSKTIDFAMVERNIGISKDYNVFELQDALIEGNALKAYRITRYFAESKDHPMVKEMGALFSFFSNLMIYHYLPDKGDFAMSKALGISPYVVKSYVAAARRYPAGKTFRIIGLFRETDARLKGMNNLTAKDPELWKELIYGILH